MSSKDLKIRFDSQFCRMNCQIFFLAVETDALSAADQLLVHRLKFRRRIRLCLSAPACSKEPPNTESCSPASALARSRWYGGVPRGLSPLMPSRHDNRPIAA